MNTALWIVAGVLAVMYLISGVGKTLIPREKMASVVEGTKWVLDFSPSAIWAIAAAEILDAIGLTLPGLLDIAPGLVPLAATGLALIMAGASLTRLRRHEPKLALADVVYLALAGFVAWGRFGPESFS
jgi:predicted permease